MYTVIVIFMIYKKFEDKITCIINVYNANFFHYNNVNQCTVKLKLYLYNLNLN
jgi:hypothetical protein